MASRNLAAQNKVRNRTAAQIGYLSARPGVTPEAVSAAMQGKVSPAEVLGIWEWADLKPKLLLPGYEVVDVAMAGRHRTIIFREAMSRGFDLPDFAVALITKVADDALFGAVLD